MKKKLFFSSMMLGLFLMIGTVSFAQTFTSSPAAAVTDNNCPTMDTDALVVSGLGVLGAGDYALATVEINISHTWGSDLEVFLVAPGGGTTVELTTGNGGNGTQYVGTIFDDAAAASITTGAGDFTGTWIPEGVLGDFNDGVLDANGTWTLEVCDGAGGDTGTIDSWSMNFVTYSFTDSPAAAITDNNCPTMDQATQAVTGIGVLGTTNVLSTVEINISHTWGSDLEVFLVAPGGGTTVELTTGNGGNGTQYVGTIFDDAAAASITTGAGDFTGTWTPEGVLGDFNNGVLDANGTWTLEVCDGAGGDIGTIDSWTMTFAPAPSCPNPSAGTVAVTSGTDADLAWTAGGAETDWNIEIGAPLFTPGTGAELFAITANPAPMITVTVLTMGTDYEYYYQANCGGAGTSAWIGPVSWNQTPPPANDNCGGAIAMTVNADLLCGSVTSGTTAFATASPEDPAGCFGTEGDDVWFTFMATAASHVIDLAVTSGGTTDLYHSVWEGTCGSLTLVAGTCSDPNNSTASGLTPGNTYHLRVYSWSNTNPAIDFDACIGTPPPPPANDNCAGVIDLGGEVSPLTASTEFALNDFGMDCLSNAGAPDVVYSILVPDGSTLTIQQDANAYDSKHRLAWGGGCPGTTLVACTDDPDTNVETFVNNTGADETAYWIQSAFSTGFGSYTLSWSIIACTGPTATFTAVEDCGSSQYSVDINVTDMGDAISYDVQDGGVSIGTVAATGITNVGPFPSGTTADLVLVHNADTDCNMANPVTFTCPPSNDLCGGAIDLICGTSHIGNTDFATETDEEPLTCGTSQGSAGVWFHYTGDGAEVTLDLSLSTFDTKVQVWEGACGALTCVGGDDDGGAGATSLFTFNSVIATEYYIYVYGFGANTGDFDMAVSCLFCVGPTATFTAVEDCGSSQYSVDIDVTDMGSAGSYDIQDGGVSIGTVAGISTVNVGPFASGTIADLTLVHNVDNLCDLANPVSFTCPPAHDAACGAVALVVNAAPITDDNSFATEEVSEVSGSCFAGGAQSTLWYTFVAIAGSETTITTDFAGGTNGDTEIALYEAPGDCADMTTMGAQLGCDQDGGAIENFNSIITINNLTGGATYYVQLSGYFGTIGTFDIQVLSVPLPPCATPTALGAANVAFDQADLTWTENGTATTWDIEWGVTGFVSTGTATVGYTAVSPNPYTLTGLAPLTTYDYYVSGAGCNMWDGPFTFTTLDTPPANDDCANATPLACGSVTAGSTTNATVDIQTDCGGVTETNNVWYTYTGSGTPEMITISTCNDGGATNGDAAYDSKLAVYSGACGTLVCEAQNDDGGSCTGFSSLLTFTSDGVSTYHIMVHGYSFPPFTYSSGDFNISLDCALACTQANANQDCASAVAQTVDGTDTGYDNTCASQALTNPSCDAFGTIADLWVSFVAPPSGSVDFGITLGTAASVNLALYSGVCGSLVQEGCNTNVGTSGFVGLTAGDTYYVQLWNDGGAFEGTFDLSITELVPPANDDMCFAEVLIVDAAPSPGSNVLATVELNEPAGANWGEAGIDNTVWYEFVAPADGQCVVTTDFAGGSNNDTQITIFNATGVTCTDMLTLPVESGSDDDAGIVVNFNSVATFTLAAGTELVGGDTYFVQVDGYFGTLGTFDIQVNTCLPVSNFQLTSVGTVTMSFDWDSQIGDNFMVKKTNLTAGQVFNPLSSGVIISGTAGSTSYTFGGLVQGNDYEFRVRNMCSDSWSAPITRRAAYGMPTTFVAGTTCNSRTLDLEGAFFQQIQYIAQSENVYFVCDNVTDPAFDPEINIFTIGGVFVQNIDGSGDGANEAGLVQGLIAGDQYLIEIVEFGFGDGALGATVDVCAMPLYFADCNNGPGFPDPTNLLMYDHTGAYGAVNFSTSWTNTVSLIEYTAGPQASTYFNLGAIGLPNESGTYDVSYTGHYEVPAGGGFGPAVAVENIDMVQVVPCSRSLTINPSNHYLGDYYAYGQTDCVTPDVWGFDYWPNINAKVRGNTALDHWRWKITDMDTPGNPTYTYDTPTNYRRIADYVDGGLSIVNAAYIADGGVGDLIKHGTCYEIEIKPNPAGADDGTSFGPMRILKTKDLAAPSIEGFTEGGGLDEIINREFTVIEAEVAIYPNPNQGEFFNLNVSGVQSEVITLDIFDMFGRLVQSEQITAEGDSVNQIVKLNGDIASGIYTVKINVNGNTTNERLVIER